MQLTEIESLLLNHCESSFYFSSTENYEIEYINPTLADILGKKSEDCLGKKCYELIYRSSTPCRDCISKQAKVSKYFNFTTNRIIKKHEYKCINTVITNERGSINIGKIIDSTDYYQVLDRCLQNAKEENFDETMIELIGVLKNFYKCDDVVILKREIGTGSFISNYNTLSNDLNLKFNEKQLSRWLFEFDKQGDLIINSLDKEVPNYTDEYTYFTKHNVSKMIVSPMRDSITVIGMIILLNPNLHKLDKFIYHTVSWFLQENFSRLNMLRELESVNHVDTLTGCYNRSTYALALRELKNNPPAHLGVVYCNINGLKKTNKMFGSKSGDKKLMSATKIMQRFFKEPFYRIGGDKFVCFVETLQEDDFYQQVLAISNETEINEKACFSVGCAFNQGQVDVGQLVVNASNIMYLNKQKYYQKSLDDALVDNTSNSLTDLLTAISRRELLVYLQPKINIQTNELVGAEALVRRLFTNDNKLVFPDKFIPNYENERIIRHLDLNVLRQVCDWQSKWIYNGRELPIAVNFSHITLQESNIVKVIADICAEYQVPHNLIMLEITENFDMKNNQNLVDVIKKLKLEGFLIALDDFGCETSNITTISKFEVVEIKIDRSLISTLDNSKNQIIINSMIDMCNQIENVQVVAEGVETLTQDNILRNFGCYIAQGFLYSKAIPADVFYERYII